MSFDRLPFEEVFADESGGNIKTPQSEYLTEGSFPVVDQGKALIAGYTNDEERVCGGGRPAIVFGDHTRCIKYLDKPFCMGADGVKVLRPKIAADLKYLFYYLKQLRLPDAGYDRHFKYLKRTEVVLPPLPEQRRIAAILDKADALRTQRREALAQLDRLAQAIFVEMFGDDAAKAADWPEVQLSDVADTLTGFAFPSNEYADGSQSAVRLCRGANVMPGRLDWSDTVWWPEQRVSAVESFELREGDVVVAMDRPWISEGFKIARVERRDCPAYLVQRVTRVRGKQSARTEYLYHLLNQHEFTRHCKPTETTVPHISPKEIRSYRFSLPPLEFQNRFIERIESLANVRSNSIAALTESEGLFAALQHRAFRGEL